MNVSKLRIASVKHYFISQKCEEIALKFTKGESTQRLFYFTTIENAECKTFV